MAERESDDSDLAAYESLAGDQKLPDLPASNFSNIDGPLFGSDETDGEERAAVPWKLDHHRSLVSAIFHEGLKQSSPSVIKEHMTLKDPVITGERIKSHLQKYRLYRDKSKAEFMDGYDDWMTKVSHAIGVTDLAASSTSLPPPQDTLYLSSSGIPLAGELAAYLTYGVIADERGGMKEIETGILRGEDSVASAAADKSSAGSGLGWLRSSLLEGNEQRRWLAKMVSTSRFVFPKLCEEEKEQPLGRMMMHIMALCIELNKQILSRRGQDVSLDGLPTTGVATVGGQSDSFRPAGSGGKDDSKESHRKKPRLGEALSSFPPQTGHPYANSAGLMSEQVRLLSENFLQASGPPASFRPPRHQYTATTSSNPLLYQSLPQPSEMQHEPSHQTLLSVYPSTLLSASQTRQEPDDLRFIRHGFTVGPTESAPAQEEPRYRDLSREHDRVMAAPPDGSDPPIQFWRSRLDEEPGDNGQ